MKRCTQIDKVRSTTKNISQIDKVLNASENNLKIDKPLVSILLAVYKPNEKWLIEQLISLNEQSYSNLDLLVYDDCPEYPVDDNVFKKYITNFNYTIIRGSVNKGSNKAFEELTKVGNGDYFAYCDQDDIWEKNKIELMMNIFNEEISLVYCDLCIIDENDKRIFDTIKKVRKRIIYKSGDNLAEGLLTNNFVTGCAMIVKRNNALKAIPFVNYILHDQWIAIISALDGKIEYINKTLVNYRQHTFNQSGVLKNIKDKDTYYKKRIEEAFIGYKEILQRLDNNEQIKSYLNKYLYWLNARKEYRIRPSVKNLRIMIKYKSFHKWSVLLEAVLPFIPDFIFKYILILIQKGII